MNHILGSERFEMQTCSNTRSLLALVRGHKRIPLLLYHFYFLMDLEQVKCTPLQMVRLYMSRNGTYNDDKLSIVSGNFHSKTYKWTIAILHWLIDWFIHSTLMIPFGRGHKHVASSTMLFMVAQGPSSGIEWHVHENYDLWWTKNKTQQEKKTQQF